MTAIAFLDTETVSLDPGPDVIWEIGVITRDDGQADQEWLFQLRPNMARAHPEALKVCRFEERYQIGRGVQALAWPPPTMALDMPPARVTYAALAGALHRLLAGRHVFGAVPSFDTERLTLFMRKHIGGGYRDPWHYHPHDVEDLAVGWMLGRGIAPPDLPWDTGKVLEALGLQADPEARHTALGDARCVRAIHDAVFGGRDV